MIDKPLIEIVKDLMLHLSENEINNLFDYCEEIKYSDLQKEIYHCVFVGDSSVGINSYETDITIFSEDTIDKENIKYFLQDEYDYVYTSKEWKLQELQEKINDNESYLFHLENMNDTEKEEYFSCTHGEDVLEEINKVKIHIQHYKKELKELMKVVK